MGKRGFKGEKTHLQKSGLLVAQIFFNFLPKISQGIPLLLSVKKITA